MLCKSVIYELDNFSKYCNNPNVKKLCIVQYKHWKWIVWVTVDDKEITTM